MQRPRRWKKEESVVEGAFNKEYVLVELNTSHCFLMEFKGFIRSRGKVKIEPHHTAMILTELIL